MLIYEHDRTEKIVDRLRSAVGVVRILSLLFSVAFFGLVGTVIFAAGKPKDDGAMIGAALGGIVGLITGSYAMGFFSAIIEWLCQLLIAQGELVERAKLKQ